MKQYPLKQYPSGITLILVCLLLLSACGGYGSDDAACDVAKSEISHRMQQSKASVTFPSCSSFNISYSGDSTYQVQGAVSVQRMLGSPLNREFSCNVKFDSNGGEEHECFFD